MDIGSVQRFFLWCTLIDYAILLVWCLVFKFAHGLHYNLTRRWFDVSPERYDEMNLIGIAFFKVAILMFNLVPYIALRLVS